MIELKGKFNSAKVFTDNVDNETISQIIQLLNQEFCKDSTIRIMPDTHAGKGCVIGTTMTIKDKVVPNLVGVDIGCGMFVSKLGKVDIELKSLDNFIRDNIPHGFNTNKTSIVKFKEINDVVCLKDLDKSTEFFLSGIGSLGGGNHFIELNVDNNENVYLVIHSGSRNFGLKVANHYQKLAIEKNKGVDPRSVSRIISELKSQGRQKEIKETLDKLKTNKTNIPGELCFLDDIDLQYYLHDLGITQRYAELNRETMAKRILAFLNIDPENVFHTTHNYIDLNYGILRKGAVSAKEGELLIIPINMRDGSILAYGKGNEDWNFSAPHGAGRLMSRSKAKQTFTLKDFKDSMKDIFSTSVKDSTIDESPMAYKPMGEIINNIQDTVEIIDIINPIYNFKA